jgi:hypothetical protein
MDSGVLELETEDVEEDGNDAEMKTKDTEDENSISFGILIQ